MSESRSKTDIARENKILCANQYYPSRRLLLKQRDSEKKVNKTVREEDSLRKSMLSVASFTLEIQRSKERKETKIKTRTLTYLWSRGSHRDV